jgi:hypothetical protein
MVNRLTPFLVPAKEAMGHHKRFISTGGILTCSRYEAIDLFTFPGAVFGGL